MNTLRRFHPFSILPLLLLAGLYGCSTSEPRPAPEPETSEPVTLVSGSEKAAPKKNIEVKASHPRQYTVKRGDTLWDIANLFLRDPWYWPEIWQRNPQVKNPHLIYPGDVLTLIYVNGRPQIVVNNSAIRGDMSGGPMPVKKLSPGIRVTSLDASIPSIPGDAIRQFLTKPRVVTRQQLDDAPRIIGSDEEQLILGNGDRVYIRGEIDKERVRFAVFNPGRALIDPETDEVLGYEAKYAGDVHITTYDDPASGELTFTEREVLIGDRLLPEDKSKLDSLYFPHLPDVDVNARIVSLYDALFGVAQYQVVVINKGERDGLEVGNLLATYTRGKVVRDRFDRKSSDEIQLPDERSGLVMIFKTFDRVSYALVMESRRVIHRNDVVKAPRI